MKSPWFDSVPEKINQCGFCPLFKKDVNTTQSVLISMKICHLQHFFQNHNFISLLV